jgi:general secretion pathway protein I
VRSRSRAGFTLIEVLVALVIVAVGMGAMLGALSSSANTVSYMRDKTFAEWVALNQIANTRLKLQQGQVPPVDTTNGDLDYAGRSWHWQQDVVATQIQGMVRIDVKVRPAEIKGDDTGWYVTLSGVAGDAVASPGITITPWDGTASGAGGSNLPPGTPGNSNSNGGGVGTSSSTPGTSGTSSSTTPSSGGLSGSGTSSQGGSTTPQPGTGP